MSFNIEGLKYNSALIDEIEEEVDVLCLQEHWLWSFEACNTLHKLLPRWECVTRSADDNENISQESCPRGHGGVAILWKKSLQPFIKDIKEGNERVLPITISLPNSKPICVICCYLPSGSNRTSIELFQEDLAVIGELVEKFNGTHSLLIAGDMNSDIFNRSAKKEMALQDLIARYSLQNLNQNIKRYSTYENQGLKHASHLDYFFADKSSPWQPSNIIKKESERGQLNSSTHCPILCKLNSHTFNRKKSSDAQVQPPKKVKWQEVDKVDFQEFMDQELDKVNFNLLSASNMIPILTSIANSASDLTTREARSKPVPKRTARVWNPRIKAAMKTAKRAFWIWKELGKPKSQHHSWEEMLKTKKILRATQRQEAKANKVKLINDIMNASERDQKLFHRLIKNSRGHSNVNPVLQGEDGLVFDTSAQRDLWADYFENLASPTTLETDHLLSLPENTLRDYHSTLVESQHQTEVTSYEVRTAVNKLNKNKAADIDNITAEHLIFASSDFFDTLTLAINNSLSTGECPDSCKSGYKIPIPKKGKDDKIRGNYRGITITAIIGKVLELVLQESQKKSLSTQESELQFGFTQGLSPSMATLCLSEALATAKHGKIPIYTVALDAQKAFDVVNHKLLKEKLHHSGVNGSHWLLFDDLYTNVTEKVKWQGVYSRDFKTGQGVRQGAVTSTTLYKLYINQLLSQLQKANLGMSIGNIYVGTPTCADDQLLLATSETDLQAMVNACHTYSQQHGYKLHPEKSTATRMINTKAEIALKLGDEPMTEVPAFTHLGLTWTAGKLTPNIAERIQIARRTSYALMGIGLHGKNGLSPSISAKIISTYVTPRLLHGLEATVLSKSQLEEISRYHRRLLRQIQGLPDSTANLGIHSLIGTLPAEAILDARILSLFGAVCRAAQHNNTLAKLTTRQLSIDNKHSWFQQAMKIALKYNINLEGTLQAPWKKEDWKNYVKMSIELHWTSHQIASKMSTLGLLDLSMSSPGSPHPVWDSCTNDARAVPAATTRARMLTGTYLTQKRKHRIGLCKDPACSLCLEEEEDLGHVLLRCPKTIKTRNAKLLKLGENITVPPRSLGTFLNGPGRKHPHYLKIQRGISEFCHAIHLARQKLMESSSGGGRPGGRTGMVGSGRGCGLG